MTDSIQIRFPERLVLGQTPTPLMPLTRLGQKLGIDLYIKRDDLTGCGFSGNKIRKLEYVLADALSKGANMVLTCGGEQSNHARATAVAASRLGLKCRLLLRTADPKKPPRVSANLLMDFLAGATVRWITPREYAQRDELLEAEAEKLTAEGFRPYVIGEGASNALGAWGYIRAAKELGEDIQRIKNPQSPVTVVLAAGSGGTVAGMILGAKLFNLDYRVVGVNVCDDEAYFKKAIGSICRSAIEEYGFSISFSPDTDIEIKDGYVGKGYAVSQEVELSLIRDVARLEGIFLDPVYTGKAFYGMVRELEKVPGSLGKQIVFLHTGGIFGLFPKSEQFESIL